MKNLIKNNKGFSLVELLVGVAILGVIVSPLLSNFILSANIFSQSREIGEATNAAQNISENLTEANFSELLSNPGLLGGNSASFTVGAGLINQNNYTIELDGLTSGTSTFSAEVRLMAGVVDNLDDSSDTVTNTLFENINNEDVINFSSMDAMFAQQKFIIGYGYDRIKGTADDLPVSEQKDVTDIDQINASGDPDLISYKSVELLEAQRRGLSVDQLGTRDAQGYISSVIRERDMIIIIENVGVEDLNNSDDVLKNNNNKITATIIYEYSYTFGSGTTNEYTYNSLTNPLECRIEFELLSVPFDVGQNGGKYPVFYVLYHPYYDNDYSTIDERITIRNNVDLETNSLTKERLPVDIYLIKQKDPNRASAQLDYNYQALIELVQPYSVSEPSETIQIFSNSNEQFSTTGGTPQNPVFRWYNGSAAYYNADWEGLPLPLVGVTTQSPTSSEIQDLEQKYRMYLVEIDIIDSRGEVIFTLYASKLA